MFSLNGDLRFKMGGVGREPGQLLHPAGVCADKYGNIFVADRDNHRVQMYDATGRYIAAALPDTCSTASGRDVRPLDVAVTSQTLLVVLLTGVEGVDFVEVHVYQLRCSLPPPEVRSVEQIIAAIRAIRHGTGGVTRPGCRDVSGVPEGAEGSGRRVKFVLPDIVRHNSTSSSRRSSAAAADSRLSQVCVVL